MMFVSENYPLLVITRDGLGRYIVEDAYKVYGCYKSVTMALRRKMQVIWSRQESKKAKQKV